MKKSILLTLLLSIVLATSAAVKQTKLRVLYVGGNSNFDIVSNIVDSLTNAQSVKERMASFEAFLKEYFTQVTVVNAKDYNYRMSYDYDVTVIDGEPQPLKPKEIIYEGQMVKKIVYAQYFPDDFDQPVLTIAELGETLGRRMGVKNDWYCLCLDQWAHSMCTSHPIFKGPYKVNITLEERPTPDGAKEYAPLLGQTLPETTPMWQVNTKGYMTHPGYKVGMVSRPWGFEDSPEAEWISSGLCAKSIDAMALGRHANFFHWGYAGGADDMTEEAKPLLANAIVYISKFAGHKPIARKWNEHIATKSYVKEKRFLASKEGWKCFEAITAKSNEQMKHFADSINQVIAQGGQVSEMEKMYAQFEPKPGKTYEEFLQLYNEDLFPQFGTDEQKYLDYYDHNAPYFYGGKGSYELTIDEDCKQLGIAVGDKRLLDKAISLWEEGNKAQASIPAGQLTSPQHQDKIDMAKRLLYRYTLLRFATPQEWRSWYRTYGDRLFWTESGGWLFMVNTEDPNIPGNDYAVIGK